MSFLNSLWPSNKENLPIETYGISSPALTVSKSGGGEALRKQLSDFLQKRKVSSAATTEGTCSRESSVVLRMTRMACTVLFILFSSLSALRLFERLFFLVVGNGRLDGVFGQHGAV